MDRDALTRRLSDTTLSFLEVLTVYLGDRLGLYRALAELGAVTARQLAARTGTHERYVREWLEQQAVNGLLEVDDPRAEPWSRHFRLPAEHAAVLVDRDSPHYQAARPMSLVAVARGLPALLTAFRSGQGFGSGDAEAREAQAELGRVGYLSQLGTVWIPAVRDVHARLGAEPSARVADVGCGVGWSSIALALAYPRARVDGVDVDADAIALARRNAQQTGVASRVTFRAGDAVDPGIDGPYDLVMAFETVHDMPRPIEALRAMRRLAGTGGTVLIVDEKVGETFETPADEVTRVNYGWSVVCCLASSMQGPEPAGTGAVMRPSTLRSYARAAGFREVEVLPIDHPSWRFYRLLD